MVSADAASVVEEGRSRLRESSWAAQLAVGPQRRCMFSGRARRASIKGELCWGIPGRMDGNPRDPKGRREGWVFAISLQNQGWNEAWPSDVVVQRGMTRCARPPETVELQRQLPLGAKRMVGRDALEAPHRPTFRVWTSPTMQPESQRPQGCIELQVATQQALVFRPVDEASTTHTLPDHTHCQHDAARSESVRAATAQEAKERDGSLGISRIHLATKLAPCRPPDQNIRQFFYHSDNWADTPIKTENGRPL
jgi:hypothetical protein